MYTYIDSIEIHQELLVKFSCNLYKILFLSLLSVTIWPLQLSSCHNISRVFSISKYTLYISST